MTDDPMLEMKLRLGWTTLEDELAEVNESVPALRTAADELANLVDQSADELENVGGDVEMWAETIEHVLDALADRPEGVQMETRVMRPLGDVVKALSALAITCNDTARKHQRAGADLYNAIDQ